MHVGSPEKRLGPFGSIGLAAHDGGGAKPSWVLEVTKGRQNGGIARIDLDCNRLSELGVCPAANAGSVCWVGEVDLSGDVLQRLTCQVSGDGRLNVSRC